MYMFDAETAARMDAIGKLGLANPFGPERPALEAAIVGEQVARTEPWSRPVDWPLVDPALPAIREEAERLLQLARSSLTSGAKPTPRDRALIRGVALYVLYYRCDAPFFESIVSPPNDDAVGFYDDFERELHAAFSEVGPPPWVRNPADLFAFFFQVRRAFHFVFHQILGTSRAAAELRASVWESIFTHDPSRYLAHLRGRMHEMSTLILGASGTGKELVASAIGLSSFIAFDPSRRRFARHFSTAFHPLNLAAMSKTLIEAELFGHKKGAFTGAIAARMGHLEGRTPSETVFLDEIGDLDPEVQVKLLRVLQSREFHRLGDTEPKRFGGKVVAATNRDLASDMASGRFRQDLYYRLCADVVHTPTLQEQIDGKPDELAHLTRVLIKRSLGVVDDATFDEVMQGIETSVGLQYQWPGNIRELDQCVRNLLIHGRYSTALGPVDTGGLEGLFQRMRCGEATLDDVATEYSAWVYRREGSFARAGEVLGVDRRTVSKHVGESEAQEK